MKWLTGRGPVPEPPAPDDWSQNRRERARTLAKVGGNVEQAVALWTDYTRQHFVQFLIAERGMGHDDR